MASIFQDLQLKKDLFSNNTEEKDWFNLELIPTLKEVIIGKFPEAFYANIEILEPELDVIVFDVCIYDKNGIDIACAEITSEEIIWE